MTICGSFSSFIAFDLSWKGVLHSETQGVTPAYEAEGLSSKHSDGGGRSQKEMAMGLSTSISPRRACQLPQMDSVHRGSPGSYLWRMPGLSIGGLEHQPVGLITLGITEDGVSGAQVSAEDQPLLPISISTIVEQDMACITESNRYVPDIKSLGVV